MTNKIKTILTIILIMLLIIAFTTGCDRVSEIRQVNNSKIYENPVNFLQSNTSILDYEDNNNYVSFNLLDQSLKDKEIFLTGIQYGIKADSELDLKFLIYFKLKAGVKYYLVQLPYSTSLYLNQYLDTGNENILEEFYKNLKGNILWNKSEYDKWKKIYELNKSLPVTEKIKIVGIDMEYEEISAFRYMYSLVEKLVTPQKIESVIADLKIIAKNPTAAPTRDIQNLCLDLKKSIEENQDLYNQYLGDKAFDLEIINANIINARAGRLYNSGNDFDKNRNKVMYENFNKLYNHLPKGKFYGQLYLNSIYQKQQMGIDYLATLMNNDKSQLKGKILSIAYIHKDCTQMIPNKSNYSTRGLTTYSSTEDILGPFEKTDLTLYRLNGDRSPFDKELIWLLDPTYTGNVPKEGVTTDYYQFMVMIKNSEATEPLN